MNSSVAPAVAEQYGGRMPAATPVNTLLCTNAHFLQHAAVCLASLLANNSALFFDIVIVAQTTENVG